MDKKPITPEGQQRLRAELDQLKNVKRQEIIDAISEARAHGDLKEMLNIMQLGKNRD